jgi:hypothetical protein
LVASSGRTDDRRGTLGTLARGPTLSAALQVLAKASLDGDGVDLVRVKVVVVIVGLVAILAKGGVDGARETL